MEVTVDCPLEIVTYLEQLATREGRLPSSAPHIQFVLSKGIRVLHVPERNDLQLDLLRRKIPKANHFFDHHPSKTFVVQPIAREEANELCLVAGAKSIDDALEVGSSMSVVGRKAETKVLGKDGNSIVQTAPGVDEVPWNQDPTWMISPKDDAVLLLLARRGRRRAMSRIVRSPPVIYKHAQVANPLVAGPKWWECRDVQSELVKKNSAVDEEFAFVIRPIPRLAYAGDQPLCLGNGQEQRRLLQDEGGEVFRGSDGHVRKGCCSW